MKQLLMKIKEKLLTREIITYLIAGVLTTLVNLAASYLFYDILGWNENLVTIVAWVIAVVFAYVINSSWVFRSKYESIPKEAAKVGKFFAARLFTYVIEALGVFIFITKMGFNYWVIKIVLMVIVTVLNYFFSKFMIFIGQGKDKNEDECKNKE
ncbi:MAG: GtrA family protein [Lachnospiraceae bacterium]|nr:GtrA family protein [Lachnospiraceae bacterium]